MGSTPEPEMVQLLDPSGERVEHADFAWHGDPALLRGMLRSMVLVRRLDTEAHALQRHGELALWPPLLGQEAAQVGAAAALGPNDHAFPSYREHGVMVAMGVPVEQAMGLWRGADHGGWNPRTFRFNPYTLVIGAQTLHATGYAMGMQLDGAVGNDDPARNGAVLSFHGDGASSQGDVNEAFVFAASYQAPVVFLCQNNQWAISEPTSRQSRIPLYRRAEGFGFPGIRVDGNDVMAMYAVSDWALQRARNGEGPTFIEAFTYRMGAHTTSDDPTKYRTSDEDDLWRARDPIERVRTYLLAQGELDQAWLDGLEAEAEEFAVRIRKAAHDVTDPELPALFDLVYAETPVDLAEQARHCADWIASFEQED